MIILILLKINTDPILKDKNIKDYESISCRDSILCKTEEKSKTINDNQNKSQIFNFNRESLINYICMLILQNKEYETIKNCPIFKLDCKLNIVQTFDKSIAEISKNLTQNTNTLNILILNIKKEYLILAYHYLDSVKEIFQIFDIVIFNSNNIKYIFSLSNIKSLYFKIKQTSIFKQDNKQRENYQKFKQLLFNNIQQINDKIKQCKDLNIVSISNIKQISPKTSFYMQPLIDINEYPDIKDKKSFDLIFSDFNLIYIPKIK